MLSEEDELALPDELLERQKERSFTRLRRRSLGPAGPRNELKIVESRGRKKLRRSVGSRKITDRGSTDISARNGEGHPEWHQADRKDRPFNILVVDADDEELISVQNRPVRRPVLEASDDFINDEGEESGASDDEAKLLRHLTSQNNVDTDDDPSHAELAGSDEETGGGESARERSRDGMTWENARSLEDDTYEGGEDGEMESKENFGREKLQFQTQKVIRDTSMSFTPKVCHSQVNLSSILNEAQFCEVGPAFSSFNAKEKTRPMRSCHLVKNTQINTPSVDIGKIQELIHGGLSSDSEADFCIEGDEGDDGDEGEEDRDQEKGQFQLAKFRIEEQRILQERGVSKTEFVRTISSIQTDHSGNFLFGGIDVEESKARERALREHAHSIDPISSAGNSGMRLQLQRKSSFRTFSVSSGGLRGNERTSRGRSFVFSEANIDGDEHPASTTLDRKKQSPLIDQYANSEQHHEKHHALGATSHAPIDQNRNMKRIFRSVSRSTKGYA